MSTYKDPSDVVTYMQTQHAAMSDVAKAPTTFKAKLPDNYLPFVWIWVRDADVDMESGFSMWMPVYVIDVLVFPVAKSAKYDSGPKLANTLLRDITALWAEDRTIGGYVKTTTRITGDIDIIPWNGVDYYGCRIQITSRMPLPTEVT